jgi:hypothetical protein
MKTLEYLPKELFNLCFSYLPRDEICTIAAYNGWIDLLKWLVEYRCQTDIYVCYVYAYGPIWGIWGERMIANAALNGHLDIIMFARKNGCPWNSRTCEYAAQNNHLNVLNWTKNNGCLCKGTYH